jgi:GTP-binding protein
MLLAIVGRPNVGKSTLFNRIVGRREAIVDPSSGVTRDRHYGEAEWAGHTFTVVDTGGWVPDSDDVFDRAIREQVTIALEQANAIVFVVDATTDLLPIDREIAAMLRVTAKPVLLAVNKCDDPEHEVGLAPFYALGLGNPYPVAALSGRQSGDLLDRVLELFPEKAALDTDSQDTRLRIAILGRPNVGKSSLTNVLIGEERHIVTDIAGTTRDSIDSVVQYEGQEIVLIDTAGLRKRKHVKESVEFYSTMRTIRALDRCTVAVVMLDATEGLHRQDSGIIAEAVEKKKGVLICVNKWDAVEKDTHTAREIELEIHARLKLFSFVPVLFISAKTHQRATTVLKRAVEIAGQRARRIPTSELNEKLLPVVEKTPPPSKQGKDLRIKYITQVRNDPPAIGFFVNYPELIEESYKRFLEHAVRELFGFEGVPVSITMRRK